MRIHSQDVFSIIDKRIKRLQNSDPITIEGKIAKEKAISELEGVEKDIDNHIGIIASLIAGEMPEREVEEWT